MPAEIRYWDSCCFIAYLADEDGADGCDEVLNAARAGSLRIVTSMLTLAEVVKLKKHKPIPIEDQTKLDDAFKPSYLHLRNVDRATAALARSLVWAEDIEPKDAIHVATALRAGVGRLDTTDKKLLARSPVSFEHYGPLEIVEPSWADPTWSASSGGALDDEVEDDQIGFDFSYDELGEDEPDDGAIQDEG